jgi:hypothetical protein
MFRSECKELFDKMKSEIYSCMTRVRSKNNVAQYIFLNYMYLKGKLVNERLSKRHFSVGISSLSSLTGFIKNPNRKLACINDVQLSEERYQELRKALLEAFDAKFPGKSKYEK